MTNAIEVRNVRKTYRRYGRRKQFGTLKSALLSGGVIRHLRPDDTFDALRDVSFSVPAGRTVGVIGRNGSGKSTLLKLIAGIGRPSEGTISVHGRVSALLELGAGFHPEISGRENIYINGMMLGLGKREIASRFDEIVDFAELREFIEAPVKTYSSGMYTRLGFAVAIHVDPAVLLVDEVLAVGDEAFTHKCLDKFADFRRRGRTVLLVTHSLDLVTRFCDEALWLDAGVVRLHGDPRRVVDAYLLDVARTEDEELGRRAGAASAQDGADGKGGPEGPPLRKQADGEAGRQTGVDDEPPDMFKASEGRPSTGSGRPEEPPDMFKAIEGRWGSREVEIRTVDILGHDAQSTHAFQSGDPLELRLHVHAAEPTPDVVFGVGIFNAEGICCYGTNTRIDGATSGEISGSGEVRFVIDRLDLVAGTYKLDVAAHRESGAPYDYHRQLYTIRVSSRVKEAGIFRPPHRWMFTGGVHVTGLSTPE